MIWTIFGYFMGLECSKYEKEGLYDRAKFILLFQKMLCLFGLLGLLVTDNPFVHIHIAYVGYLKRNQNRFAVHLLQPRFFDHLDTVILKNQQYIQWFLTAYQAFIMPPKAFIT